MQRSLKIASGGTRSTKTSLSIRDQLDELMIRKWVKIHEILQGLLAQTEASSETRKVAAIEAVRVAREADELLKWAYPSRKPISAAAAVARVPILREQGYDEDAVKWMVAALQKNPEGKRQTVRATHIQAFEFMLQSKSNSLGIAINHFCKCGRVHDKKCRSSFRYGIQELKKILRKHLPHLIVKYDALHPDRNPKRS
jgi:hypothetical protein